MVCPCCKRLKVEEGNTIDRLTDLPINVIHQIQNYLSMEEAARMSVLSRPWRHVWASIPKLVFSPQFCQSRPSSDTLIKVIQTILSKHIGAIKIFRLNISSVPSSQHSIIDEWMLLLSKNGVRDLSLQNPHNAPYELPSCMFGVELERLNLSNCIFRPPCSFRSFHKLMALSLIDVVLEFDNVAPSSLRMRMPNLFFLQAHRCTGFPNSKIDAPELLRLYIESLKTLDLGNFMDCQKLKIVVLASSRNNQDRVINLTYLLESWSVASHFKLDSYYLKSLATEIETLTTSLKLKSLTLFDFDFDDEGQIHSLLGMLRSSPNLKKLLLMVRRKKKNGGMEVDVNHFEGPAFRTLGLNKLERLKIFNFRGSRTEMLFVRSILSSAPLLPKTILDENAESVHRKRSLKISKA